MQKDSITTTAAYKGMLTKRVYICVHAFMYFIISAQNIQKDEYSYSVERWKDREMERLEQANYIYKKTRVYVYVHAHIFIGM